MARNKITAPFIDSMAKNKKQKQKQQKQKQKNRGYVDSDVKSKKSVYKTDYPLLDAPEDINGNDFLIDADQVAAEEIDFTDPTFTFDQLESTDISSRDVSSRDISSRDITSRDITSEEIEADELANRFMTRADYELVDPAEVEAEYGDITRDSMRKNSKLSSELALEALDTELKGLQNFAPAAANLKRQQLAEDNRFNTQQRLDQLESVDPSIRKDLESAAGRARAYAEGRVPDSITDRQLELGIQSRAADRAATGGFGAGSSAARKAGQLMSAEQRIALSQAGDAALAANIDQRTNTLVAPTSFSDAGQQISVTPTVSAGQAAMAIASEANAGNITARDALASKTQQGQFRAELDQDTNKTNLLTGAERDINQARLNLEAGTTNEANRLNAATTSEANRLQAATVSESNRLDAARTSEANRLDAAKFSAANDLQAQTVNAANRIQVGSINADNQIRTQLAGKELQSAERRFNAELKTNTAIANADRSFQAANANAGRRLEVATTNRAVRMEVERTNKNMVFQDIQRQKSERFSAAQNRASNAAANSRAAMSASAQAAALQAQREEAAIDREFQLQQQQQALDLYYANRNEAQDSADSGAAGTIISRIPDVVNGVSNIINTIGDWF